MSQPHPTAPRQRKIEQTQSFLTSRLPTCRRAKVATEVGTRRCYQRRRGLTTATLNERMTIKSQKEPEPRLPPMAYLRIRGRWLNRAGFVGGTRVGISVSQGRPVFEAVGPAYPPQRRRPLPRPMAEENRIVGSL